MPDLVDKIYCSEQIHIPPTFPYIMKLYCKAAIRTQPYDLLKWSAAYFRALANGEEPPTKERIEYPPYDSPSGLTPGYLRILINQFGKDPETTVTAQTLFKKWSDVCLHEQLLVRLIALLGATTTINWVKFVGICAGYISKTLTQTMTLVCELFTEEPEGGMATVPFTLFIDLYIYLAQMECGPLTEKEQQEQDAILYEEDICDIADRIKEGLYDEEAEGEAMYGEEVGEDRPVEICIREEVAMDEEESSRGSAIGYAGEGEGEDKGEASSADQKDLVYGSYSVGSSEKGSVRDGDSSKSESATGEDRGEMEGEGGRLQEKGDGDKKPEVAQVEVVADHEDEEEDKPKYRKINLDDMEDSIRARIEARLAEEEEEDYGEDQEKEFEELNSYLLGAAARVQKYTAEALGYRIFRKYMRQDVPGIGPSIESEQVEKVVDFMDFWSNKQEGMVMPRNIRHWMCPPLDKLPTPEP